MLNQKINSEEISARKTYLHTEYDYLETCRKNGDSAQKIKNKRTALKYWRISLNLNFDSFIGKEMNEDFQKSLDKFRDNQINRGLQKSTYYPRLSEVRDFQVFYLKFEGQKSPPKKFGSRLKQLIYTNNYSLAEFHKKFLFENICERTLQVWCNGKGIPKEASIVAKIEKILEVPPGNLTFLLPFSSKEEKNETSAAHKNRLKRSREKYTYTTPQIDEELEEYFRFKSFSVIPDNLERHKKGLWTTRKDGVTPTGDKIKKDFKRFIGFCKLSSDNANPCLRGLDMPDNQLTLGLLVRVDIVEEYITAFRKIRSNNRYNGGHLSFIANVTSILRKDTGYLYQKPEYARKLGLNISPREWRKICLKTRERLLKIKKRIEEAKKNGSEDYTLGRDPAERINDILALDSPVQAMIEMLNKMLVDMTRITGVTKQATLFRNALLVAMLIANPLRIRMFSEMALTENLVQKKDGSWWIKFRRQEFKNRHSLRSDYEVRLNTEIWWMIEKYLFYYRPLLVKSLNTQTLFVSNCGKTVSSIQLSKVIRLTTKKYHPDCLGFGPHSFRHIIATDIIRRDPNFGFFLAAKVLHDKQSTVEENYAHLKTNEFYEPYNNLLSIKLKASGFSSDYASNFENDVIDGGSNEQ